jgi:hypothetical protein
MLHYMYVALFVYCLFKNHPHQVHFRKVQISSKEMKEMGPLCSPVLSREEKPAISKQPPPNTMTPPTSVFRGSVGAVGHLRQKTKLVYRLQTSLLLADVGVARPYNRDSRH